MIRSGKSERMKRLDNANAHRNTLDGPPMANARQALRAPFPSFDGTFGGGTKRLRDRGRETTYENRDSKRLRPNPASSRDAVRRSQNDAIDTESVGKSTASNDDRRPKKTNQLRQEEFRSSQLGTPRSRRRRNRKRPATGARERQSSEGVQRVPEPSRSMSPDELQDSSPPLVKSDLPPRASAIPKPSRPIQRSTGSGSLPFDGARHRHKDVAHEDISDDSDDELAHDGTEQRVRTKPRASATGTQWQSACPGSEMRVCQAVSGTHTFRPEKNVKLVLSGSGTSWNLVTEDGKPIRHPWLQLDVGRMNKITHNLRSEIVVVHRPQAKNIPAMLVLQFEHEKAARQFLLGVTNAHAPIKFEEKPSQSLTNTYTQSLRTAQRGWDRDLTGCLPAGNSPKSGGFDAASSPPGDETQRGEATGAYQPPKTRLIDRLSSSTGQNPVSRRPSSPLSKPPVALRTRRATRRSAPEGLADDEDAFHPRWSLDNTSWEKKWDRELVYPSTGRNRATVHKEDIRRLDEGAFLNDSLVFCYLRYLQVEMDRERPDISKRIYFMNTYFFEILRKAKAGLINYEGVKSWTSKVDIFSYDYIVVPVNEEAHWYLAIICNPRVVVEGSQDADDDVVFLDSREELRREELASPKIRRKNESELHSSPSSTKDLRAREKGQHAPVQKVDSKDIRIITLDSLGAPHSKTCQMLRKYLVEEAKSRKNVSEPELDRKIGLTAKNIPSQANFCDCGVFLLGYAQRFLEDPDGFVGTILQRGKPTWTVDASQLRNEVRETLFRLHTEYREELVERKKQKRKKRLGEGKQGALSTDSSDNPVSEALDRAGSVPDERHPSQNLPLTDDGDSPSPTREQAGGGCSVEPKSVGRQDEGRTGPDTSPQATLQAEERKPISSPDSGVQNQDGHGTSNTDDDAQRVEETKIRPSIEHDGDQSPSPSHNTSSSRDPSSTRGQLDQPDDMAHSPSAASPPDTRTYEALGSPSIPLKASIEKPDEPDFIKRLSSSPKSARSAGSPILGEKSPRRKRRAKYIEIEGDGEPPQTPKKLKGSGAGGRYFGSDEGQWRFTGRRYDDRASRPQNEFEHGGARKVGQGRRSSDAIDLTGKEDG